MTHQDEKTALSVGAEKQLGVAVTTTKVLKPNISIAQSAENSNKKFTTIDGKTLIAQEHAPIKFIVSNFISQGLHIIAGSPKTGKS